MNSTDNAQPAPLMILGEVASSGLARGRALLCDCAKQTVVPRRQVSEAEVGKEIERFDSAVSAAEGKLLEVQANVRRTLGKGEAEIFEAQILLMRDAQLRDAVRDLCLEKRINVEAALDEAITHLMDLFGRLEDPYFRERAADLHDVGKRLLEHLAKNLQPSIPTLPEGCVLVTNELLASVAAQLEGHGVRGLIVEKGGLTAHATILARALNIPMLVQVAEATNRIRAGDLVIVDALAGRVFINPKPEILRKYDQLEADLQIHQSALKGLIDLPAVTRDGVEIKLCANIGQTADAVAAANVKADGVGLYRTEFIFLVQDHFPSEAEQYQFYHTTAEHLQPGETVIRVLDIGSDKPLPYFPLTRETNPALGCRGTRLLLAHPTVLHTQLRAILRLSASHPVAILLDLHAVSGPGGGAASSFTAPGHSSQFSFKALHSGLFVYHCATAPVGMHIGNGMYGLILVEPKEGLPPVDHEYYMMQGEFYTTGKYGDQGLQGFDMDKAVDERPPYVVFNGAVDSLVGDRALTAKVGETNRLFFGNGGPNLTSSFHIIGGQFDALYEDGTMTNFLQNVQTTTVPPGSAVVVDFKAHAPGTYVLVDHAVFRAFNKGALGMLKVDGPQNLLVYSGKEVDATYIGKAAEAGSEAEKKVAALQAQMAEEIKSNPKIAGLTKDIQVQKGNAVFMQTCFVCHQPEGQGVAGQIPPLAKSDFLATLSKEDYIRGVLMGRTGQIVVNGKTYNGTMVPLNYLSDEQIANVLTYVRNSWGNSGEAVTPQEVTRIRQSAAPPPTKSEFE